MIKKKKSYLYFNVKVGTLSARNNQYIKFNVHMYTGIHKDYIDPY